MRAHKRNAQVFLEFAFAIAGVVILFWAAAEIFFYVNLRLVKRQECYESDKNYGRLKAAQYNTNKEIQVNETTLGWSLDFFK